MSVSMERNSSKKNDDLDQIRRQVLAGLADEDVSIALFGSQALGATHASSDVDIAVIPKGAWDQRKLTLLREKLEESNIPYKVDIVDFSFVSHEFRRLALESVIWWRP